MATYSIVADMMVGTRPALKELGSKAIQDALTKAICELTDEDYRVDVNSIDFEADTGSWMHDDTKLQSASGVKRPLQT